MSGKGFNFQAGSLVWKTAGQPASGAVKPRPSMVTNLTGLGIMQPAYCGYAVNLGSDKKEESMRLGVAAVVPVLFCALVSPAPAGQSKDEIDAAMVKIYAASGGTWKSETHSRNIGRGTDWSTQPGHGSCTQVDTAKKTCEGKTGDESWVDNWRVENGVEYLEGKSGGETFKREFRITHAWFTDKNNYGEERTFVAKGFKDVEYEGIDTFIQMGNRFIALRKVREKGSGGDYQYSVFHMTSRAE